MTAVLAGGFAFAGLGGGHNADATPESGPRTAPGPSGTAVSEPRPTPSQALALLSATSGAARPSLGPSGDYQPRHRADVPADSVGSAAYGDRAGGSTAGARSGDEPTTPDGAAGGPTGSAGEPSGGAAEGPAGEPADGSSTTPAGSDQQDEQEPTPTEEPTPSGDGTPEDDGSGGVLEDVTGLVPGLDALPSVLPSALPTSLPSSPTDLLP